MELVGGSPHQTWDPTGDAPPPTGMISGGQTSRLVGGRPPHPGSQPKVNPEVNPEANPEAVTQEDFLVVNVIARCELEPVTVT